MWLRRKTITATRRRDATRRARPMRQKVNTATRCRFGRCNDGKPPCLVNNYNQCYSYSYNNYNSYNTLLLITSPPPAHPAMSATTSTPSKVTLPPLSSILYTPSKEVSTLVSHTASTPNTTFNDSSLGKFGSSSFHVSSTSSPILKKSISFPIIGLPAPIQFPSLNATISQSRYTLTNQIPSANNAILQLREACKTTVTKPLAESSFIHSTPIVKRTKSVPLPDNTITTTTTTTTTTTNTSKPKFKIQPFFKTPITTSNDHNSRKRTHSDSSTSTSTSTSPTSSFAFISHSQETFLSNEPDIDNARLARRKRRRTSPLELSILQEEFQKGITPNKKRREEIASKVDMTEKAVQIWFQNKRQAMRKANPKPNVSDVSTTTTTTNNNENEKEKEKEKEKGLVVFVEYGGGENANESVIDVESNKENIDPQQQQQEQQPRQSQHTNPLRDITNQTSLKSRTQKFKHTHFGLVEQNDVPQRRQKPLMKVKMRVSNISTENSNSFYGSQSLIFKD